MICYKLLITILVIFFKTGNVLSLENIFNVNNIEITKKKTNNIEFLANEAIKKGANFCVVSKNIKVRKSLKKLGVYE